MEADRPLQPDHTGGPGVVPRLGVWGFDPHKTLQNEKARRMAGTVPESSVELTGFEPVASSMPWKRATNCAIAPRLSDGF